MPDRMTPVVASLCNRKKRYHIINIRGITILSLEVFTGSATVDSGMEWLLRNKAIKSVLSVCSNCTNRW